MALSNIRNEPRREITETVFGFFLLAAWLYLGYLFGCWFQSWADPKDHTVVVAGMLIWSVGTVLLLPLAHFIHFLGEEVCDALAGLRLDPRPKNRPNRR